MTSAQVPPKLTVFDKHRDRLAKLYSEQEGKVFDATLGDLDHLFGIKLSPYVWRGLRSFG